MQLSMSLTLTRDSRGCRLPEGHTIFESTATGSLNDTFLLLTELDRNRNSSTVGACLVGNSVSNASWDVSGIFTFQLYMQFTLRSDLYNTIFESSSLTECVAYAMSFSVATTMTSTQAMRKMRIKTKKTHKRTTWKCQHSVAYTLCITCSCQMLVSSALNKGNEKKRENEMKSRRFAWNWLRFA